MAGTVAFPCLSEDAWVTNTVKVADQMMAHFFTSNYSQSYIYAGYVSSFPYILAINHGSISSICSETKNALVSYFSRFFQNVVVEVQEVPNEDEPSKAQISILVQFVDYENKPYSVGQILRVTGSTFEKVAAINNG